MQVQGAYDPAVTVEEFKRAIHVRPEDTEDDSAFLGLLSAAQAVVETATNRPLTPRVALLSGRAGIGLRWWLPCAPVSAVTQMEWRNAGVWADLDLTGVYLEQGDDEPQLVFPAGFWDGVNDGAALRVTAAVGGAIVPKLLWQAIILMASEWYEAGINPETGEAPRLSFGVRALIRQGRYKRPCEWASV